jgi:hypothetical protein
LRTDSMRHTRTSVGRTMRSPRVDHIKRKSSFRLIRRDKSMITRCGFSRPQSSDNVANELDPSRGTRSR